MATPSEIIAVIESAHRKIREAKILLKEASKEIDDNGFNDVEKAGLRFRIRTVKEEAAEIGKS